MPKSISMRLTEDEFKIIKKVMDDNQLNQSQAIKYLILNSAVNDKNVNHYKQSFLKLALDMTNAINDFRESGEKDQISQIMEEFKCQIL